MLEQWYYDVENIKCHETNAAIINPASKKKMNLIACPVDVAISSNNAVIAEVKNEELINYVNDPSVQVSTFINDDYDGWSKALIVPYDYDVKIAGYDNGKMKLLKAVINNGIITDIASFEDIPVSKNVQYTEVIENERLVAINGTDENGNTVFVNYPTASNNDLSDATITLASKKVYYKGKAICPKVTITPDSANLTHQALYKTA